MIQYLYTLAKGITTINLVNIHHYIQLLFVMIIFKSYFLCNFKIYNSVLLTTVTMLYSTTQGLIYFITASFYLLTIFTHKIDKKLLCWFNHSLYDSEFSKLDF